MTETTCTTRQGEKGRSSRVNDNSNEFVEGFSVGVVSSPKELGEQGASSRLLQLQRSPESYYGGPLNQDFYPDSLCSAWHACQGPQSHGYDRTATTSIVVLQAVMGILGRTDDQLIC